MKRYTFEIVIEEGSDEWWEEITADGKSGCDEVLADIKEKVAYNFPESVRLIKFEDK
jgi:hypothetical protein